MVEKFEVGRWYRIADGVTESTMRYGFVEQMRPLLDGAPVKCLAVSPDDEARCCFEGIGPNTADDPYWSYSFTDFDEVPAPDDVEHVCSSRSHPENISVGDGSVLMPGDSSAGVPLSTKERISLLCDAMKDLLIYKNGHYGDSALHPAGVFYKGDAATSIYIRMDDKLNRIKNSPDTPKVNDLADLIGYGFLALAKRMETEDVLAAIEKEKD